MDQDESQAVAWFRRAASHGHELAKQALDEWDTELPEVMKSIEAVFDPDPRQTVISNHLLEDDSVWFSGCSEEGMGEVEFEGETLCPAAFERLSPWVVSFVIDVEVLDERGISIDELRRAAFASGTECGHEVCVTTAGSEGMSPVMRVRVVVSSDEGAAPPEGAAEERAEDQTATSAAAAAAGSSDGASRELTVYLADGTSHKLAVSPATAVREIKQHLRAALRGPDAERRQGEAERGGFQARPFFWQDEHAVQRLHIFVHGAEDELADARSMGSLGNPPALFLLTDDETSFMGRLEAEAAALCAHLKRFKVRDLARCDAALASAAEAAVAEVQAGAAAAEDEAPDNGSAAPPPCKKSKRTENSGKE